MEFLRVTKSDQLIWLAVHDSELRLWVYLPSTRMFHFHASLYEDYWDQQLDYDAVNVATAWALLRYIDEEPAARDSETMQRLAREPALTVKSALSDEPEDAS